MARRLFHVVAALLLTLAGGLASAQVQTLARAQVQTRIVDVLDTQEMSLPYHWDGLHRGQAGSATFSIPFNLETVPTEPFGIYISRLGNAYEVWVNGILLQRNGDMVQYNGSDFSKVPRFVPVPSNVLQTRNMLEVRIRADIGRRGGLTAPQVGLVQDVYPLYYQDYRWRGTGSLVVAIVSVLVALLALSLWATQVDVGPDGRVQRDRLYFYAGIAELFWTLRVGDAIVDNPPLPWVWWGTLMVLSAAVWAMGMALFCMEVAGWSGLRVTRWLRRWLLLLLVLGVPVAVAALALGYPMALTLWYGVGSLTFITFVGVFIWKAMHSGVLAHKVMAVVLMLNALMGLRDLVVFRLVSGFGSNSLQRYSSILFGLTLGYIVLLRFRSVSDSARELMASLAARVAEKERELNSSFQRLEALAREQERTQERTRILRDMHDGVGAHISAAIRQLQSGQTSNDMVLLTLRDSLDQLKLSIDAMHLAPGDITALLANVRYRLGSRFAAMNLDLQWAVEELPLLAYLDAAAMRQLQFIVFEALSNVMQHARATTLCIDAAVKPAIDEPGLREVCVRISDNGTGFDVQAAGKRGLATMGERARAIGARWGISSRPGATVVELRFPMDARRGMPAKR